MDSKAILSWNSVHYRQMETKIHNCICILVNYVQWSAIFQIIKVRIIQPYRTVCSSPSTPMPKLLSYWNARKYICTFIYYISPHALYMSWLKSMVLFLNKWLLIPHFVSCSSTKGFLICRINNLSPQCLALTGTTVLDMNDLYSGYWDVRTTSNSNGSINYTGNTALLIAHSHLSRTKYSAWSKV